jgi:hypothetical protein
MLKSYKKTGKPFRNGAPQLTLVKRNGTTFTKTYRSLASRGRSITAWRSAGGTVLKKGTFTRKK